MMSHFSSVYLAANPSSPPCVMVNVASQVKSEAPSFPASFSSKGRQNSSVQILQARPQTWSNDFQRPCILLVNQSFTRCGPLTVGSPQTFTQQALFRLPDNVLRSRHYLPIGSMRRRFDSRCGKLSRYE